MLQSIASTPSRTRQVYEAIRDRICDLTLKPGTHLVQEELAESLGVSRQPVQQAMLLLKSDGLVVERGARGLYVVPLDLETVEHHYQIRLVLDELAARLVAGKAARSVEFANELRREGESILADGTRAIGSGSSDGSVRYDVDFHNLIYRMSGNPLIATTLDSSWYVLRRMMLSVLLHANRGQLVWRQHREILDSLVRGDVNASVRLVSEHIVGAHEALIAALRASRDGQPSSTDA